MVPTQFIIDNYTKKSYFDLELSKKLEVIIIEKVDFGDKVGDDKSKFLKEKEFYWQTQLNTFESFGGLNKRDPRDEIISS